MSKLKDEVDEKKEEFIIYLTNQGINVFNLSDKFYNDLCYHFDSPNGKDVPMKDRIQAFYPNITLCDKGCDNKGVDLETMKARCECLFSDLMKNDFMDNLYGQAITEVMDIISSLNIGVVQCFKDIFNKEEIKKCVGGFFILGLLGGQLSCVITFMLTGLYNIRKLIFSLSESFKLYMEKNNVINSPPKKKKGKTRIINHNKKDENNPMQSSKNMLSQKSNNNLKKSSRGIFKYNKNNSKSCTLVNETFIFYEKNNTSRKSKKSKAKIMKYNKIMNFSLKTEKSEETKHKINLIKNILTDSFDESDFDDVLNGEQRTYCQYFSEVFKNNQIFINAFCIHEILRPR